MALRSLLACQRVRSLCFPSGLYRIYLGQLQATFHRTRSCHKPPYTDFACSFRRARHAGIHRTCRTPRDPRWIIYLAIGLFRLGFFIQLVPQSVVVGFSSAAAAIIVISQLPTFSRHIFYTTRTGTPEHRELVERLPALSFFTLLAGIIAATLLLVGKKLPKVFPSALFVLIFGIVASYLLHLGEHGITLIATVPSSLPSFVLPSFRGTIPFSDTEGRYHCARRFRSDTCDREKSHLQRQKNRLTPIKN